MNSFRRTNRIADVPVALLAGGMATRLGDITRQVPKALVEIGGRPFIDHQLELLRRNGIRRVVLCVGHFGEQIEEHLGDGAAFGMKVRYSNDGPVLAGTGGAIRRALPLLGDLFWVMYGDSYMDIDYGDVLETFLDSAAGARPLGLMTVIRNEDRWDRSNVIFEDGRLIRYDKRDRSPAMQYIDYGVQLLRSDALDSPVCQANFDLSDLYRDLVSRGQMIGCEVFNRFYEIGTPSALDETRRYLAGTCDRDLKASA